LYRYPGLPVYYFVQIDWEESTLLQRVCVRPHIDEELDNRKHVYNGIDAVLVSAPRLTDWVPVPTTLG
jgi:DNA mismatch repair protein MSH5